MITKNLVLILALVACNKTVGKKEGETKSKSIANIVLAFMIILPLTVIVGGQIFFSTPVTMTPNVFGMPVGTFTYEPQHPCVNETVTFNASVSYDPDGCIVSYYWEFGDGTNDTGIVAEHSYPEAGDYLVRLTVTDNDRRFCTVLQFLNVTSDIEC